MDSFLARKFPLSRVTRFPLRLQSAEKVGIATGAVGLITDPIQAEKIISSGEADAVFLARAMLRDPYWPLHAAKALKADTLWPAQYLRAKD